MFLVKRRIGRVVRVLPFTAYDRAVIAPALGRLSKTVPTSGSGFADFVQGLGDDIGTSPATNTKSEKAVDRQKELVSVAQKSADVALNDVTGSRKQVAVAGMQETVLVPCLSVASGQIVRATVEVRQARDTILCRVKSWR